MGADKEEEEDRDDEEEDEEKPKLAATEAKEASQLDSITDYVEEREASTKIDAKEVEERLNELRKKKEEEEKRKAERQKQLKEARIKKEDLDLMCAELPLCERDALERVLREHSGDLVAALKSAVRSFPTNS